MLFRVIAVGEKTYKQTHRETGSITLHVGYVYIVC